MTGPLSGIRVVEVAQYVAGPMAGLMLSDLGADVVKVETGIKGDPFRTYGLRWHGMSAFWLNVNRGKRCVALDLDAPADQQHCRDLIARADVVLISSRPGALDDAGLDDATLAELNPALVRVYVTGFGPTGPRAQERVYDSLVQAMSGLVTFQGGDRGPEVLAPMAVDKVTAIFVAQAAIAALYERGASGEGRRIDLSLLDAAAYWNFPDLGQDRTFVDDERRLSRLGSPIVATSDGHVVVAPVTGRQIALTADALGHPEWVDDLKQIPDHTVMTAELYRRIAAVTATMTAEQVMDRMREHGVPTGPVLDFDQHLVEPQVVHNDLYQIVADPDLGAVRTVRYPAAFDGAPTRPPFTAPALGADAESIARDWHVDLGPKEQDAVRPR